MRRDLLDFPIIAVTCLFNSMPFSHAGGEAVDGNKVASVEGKAGYFKIIKGKGKTGLDAWHVFPVSHEPEPSFGQIDGVSGVAAGRFYF